MGVEESAQRRGVERPFVVGAQPNAAFAVETDGVDARRKHGAVGQYQTPEALRLSLFGMNSEIAVGGGEIEHVIGRQRQCVHQAVALHQRGPSALADVEREQDGAPAACAHLIEFSPARHHERGHSVACGFLLAVGLRLELAASVFPVAHQCAAVEKAVESRPTAHHILQRAGFIGQEERAAKGISGELPSLQQPGLAAVVDEEVVRPPCAVGLLPHGAQVEAVETPSALHPQAVVAVGKEMCGAAVSGNGHPHLLVDADAPDLLSVVEIHAASGDDDHAAVAELHQLQDAVITQSALPVEGIAVLFGFRSGEQEATEP